MNEPLTIEESEIADLKRQLAEAQADLSATQQKRHEAAECYLKQYRQAIKERDEAQAACAEMRQFLGSLPKGEKPGRVLLAAYDLDDIEGLLSSTCGRALLDELERYRKALEEIASVPQNPECWPDLTFIGIVRWAKNVWGIARNALNLKN